MLYLAIASIIGLLLGWYLGRYRSQDLPAGKFPSIWQNQTYLRGLNYVIARQADKAISEFSKLAQENPDMVEIYLSLGNLFREQGELERAIWIHQGLIVRPTLSVEMRLQAMMALGMDYSQAGVVDRATATFRQVIANHPEYLPVYQYLEQLYEQESNWEQAYLTQQKILNLTRSKDMRILAHLQVQLAKEYQSQGDLLEAGKRLHTALYLEPKSSDAQLYLGDIYQAQGETDKAAGIWEGMLRNQAKFACLAYRRLEEAYWSTSQYERIERLYMDILKKNPQDLRARLALIDYYTRQGKIGQALVQIRQGLLHQPQNRYLRETLLQLLIQAGSLPMEAETVKTLKDTKPDEIPFVCSCCGYETTVDPWKCPCCRQWDTFGEG